MADDIVPELLEAIQQAFADFVAADADITALLEKVAAGTATHAETEEYALLIGEYAASALKINLTAETLPDGTLYYNIAERTIPPTLQQSYEMVTDVAAQVQQTLNEAAGIGIKPITEELDTERVEGIVNAAVNAESVEAAQKVISESVVNITQSFADDFVQANAEFHYQAGLKPTITRKVVGGCCDWCMSLAGTYEYGQHPKDIFRRHKNCRCTVTYDPGDGSKEDVWTKKTVTSSEDTATIEERKTVGLSSGYDKKKYPVDPVSGDRYISHKITIDDYQFGKKIGKHASEFGIDISDEASRSHMREIIQTIVNEADERCYGSWRGQEYPVLFHIKGEDVVIESNTGRFVSILKGGASNARVKNARK